MTAIKRGDEVWYWQRLRGSPRATRIFGRVIQTDGTHARVRRHDACAVPIVTVEVKQLKTGEDE